MPFLSIGVNFELERTPCGAGKRYTVGRIKAINGSATQASGGSNGYR
ncbi:MAG: hypothetical protein O3B45_08580 [Bacteroidetes bacterium]|nr:hypothetical protein [Bacteroidota bacterium]